MWNGRDSPVSVLRFHVRNRTMSRGEPLCDLDLVRLFMTLMAADGVAPNASQSESTWAGTVSIYFAHPEAEMRGAYRPLDRLTSRAADIGMAGTLPKRHPTVCLTRLWACTVETT